MHYRWSVALGLLACLLPFDPARAHFLTSSNSMTSILHIEPNDVPIVGRAATFEYQLQDSTNRFRLNQCDCTLHLHRNGQEIFFQKLSRVQPANSIITPGVTYTFKQPGHYEAALVGQPLPGATFQQFTLVDPVFVVNDSASGAISAFWYTAYHFLAHYAYVAVFLVMFIYLFARKQLTFQQKRPTPGTTQ